MDTYLQNFASHLALTEGASPLTVQGYTRYLLRFFSMADISHPRKITESKVHAFRVALYAEQLAKSTVSLHLSALRKFLHHLKKQGVETFDWTLIELPKKGKRLPKVHSRETYEKILLEAKSHDILTYTALMVIYSTGLRIHELAALPKVLNLDADQGYMVRGKGDKDRVVYFNSAALEAISAYLAHRTDTSPRLFPVAIGNLSFRLKRAAHRAGFVGQEIGAHSFRHFFATEFYRTTKDLIALQELLGHSSIETTRIYVHIVNEDKKRLHALLPSFG